MLLIVASSNLASCCELVLVIAPARNWRSLIQERFEFKTKERFDIDSSL